MQLTPARRTSYETHLETRKGLYEEYLLDEFPDPKPAATTVATLLKRMTLKGFVGFEQHGSDTDCTFPW